MSKDSVFFKDYREKGTEFVISLYKSIRKEKNGEIRVKTLLNGTGTKVNHGQIRLSGFSKDTAEKMVNYLEEIANLNFYCYFEDVLWNLDNILILVSCAIPGEEEKYIGNYIQYLRT